jgi:hypothetical protein
MTDSIVSNENISEVEFYRKSGTSDSEQSVGQATPVNSRWRDVTL